MISRDVTALINWYQREKRDLPWRNTRDPYLIWLSEVILQQTRVEQGLPYYQRFQEFFPTVSDLAKASQDEVLACWQGLGYYSRGRNLHATAQLIHQQGQFPASYQSLLELKGIGPYTAAAIASFAFHESVAVLDGNVFRVVSRFLADSSPIDSTATRKKFQLLLNEWIAFTQHPHLFNQATMELGALVCTPKNPKCNECPLQSHCEAFAKNTVTNYPVKKGKTKVVPLHLYYAVVKKDDLFFVVKRPEQGIWAGLFDFPSVESEDNTDAILQLTQQLNLKDVSWMEGKTLNHVLSHRKITAHFHETICDFIPTENGIWKSSEELVRSGVSALLKKYVQTTHIR